MTREQIDHGERLRRNFEIKRGYMNERLRKLQAGEESPSEKLKIDEDMKITVAIILTMKTRMSPKITAWINEIRREGLKFETDWDENGVLDPEKFNLSQQIKQDLLAVFGQEQQNERVL